MSIIVNPATAFRMRSTLDGCGLSAGEQRSRTNYFSILDKITAIEELIARYEHVPMSFADACLVRMTALYPESTVLTLDNDFRISRQHRNQAIAVIMPE